MDDTYPTEVRKYSGNDSWKFLFQLAMMKGAKEGYIYSIPKYSEGLLAIIRRTLNLLRN